MCKPDWEGVRSYVLERLARELPPDLTYHGVHHTRDDVLPAVERLAAHAGLDAERTLLLRTAALFHDTGFLIQYADNEEAAVAFAEQTLPQFDYTLAQIEAVQALIRATRMPQQPQDSLQALLCDADLDSLGREDFLVTSHALRQELKARGLSIPLKDWYIRQLQFISAHRYFTETARSLRDAEKQRNITEIRRRLDEIR